MRITRREFLQYCTVAAGALGLTATDLLKIEDALAKAGGNPSKFGAAPYVVWIPGQACTGCTVSFANTITYTDVASLVLNDISVNYQEQLVAAAGDLAVESAVSAIGRPMVLAIEGSIPYGGTNNKNEDFCTIWSRTGGILAAGSHTGGATFSVGTLVSRLTGNLTGSSVLNFTTGAVLAAGSELVAGTTLPIGSIVESAGDRAVMSASPFSATFNSTWSSYGGSDRTNRNVQLTAPLSVSVGVVEIFGGTDESPQYPTAGSSLSGGTTLATGTIVTSSFDRLWLENKIGNFGETGPTFNNATPTTTFRYLGTGSDWALTEPITINASRIRTVSGPMSIASNSTIATGSILKAGTRVTGAAVRSSLITLSGIPTLFGGYGTATQEFALATPLVISGTNEIFLTGKVTIPAGLNVRIGSTDPADKTMYHEAKLFGTSAAYILCIGTCSSFGGIPAAQGNLTNASGVLYKGLRKPGQFNGALNEFAGKTINIPGCPPHPDWIVGTIAYLLKTNYSLPPLEAYSRPYDYFGEYICNAGPCEWRYNQGYNATDETNYDNPKVTGVAKLPGAPNYAKVDSAKLYKFKWANDGNNKYVGCIGALGCKGRKTKADCSLRRWNADNNLKYGVGWCVMSGAGCHGCTEPTFPDKVGKFFNFA